MGKGDENPAVKGARSLREERKEITLNGLSQVVGSRGNEETFFAGKRKEEGTTNNLTETGRRRENQIPSSLPHRMESSPLPPPPSRDKVKGIF